MFYLVRDPPPPQTFRIWVLGRFGLSIKSLKVPLALTSQLDIEMVLIDSESTATGYVTPIPKQLLLLLTLQMTLRDEII